MTKPIYTSMTVKLSIIVCFIIITIIPTFSNTIQRVSTNPIIITFDSYQDIFTHTYIQHPHIAGVNNSLIESNINAAIDDTILNSLRQQNQNPLSRKHISYDIGYTIYYVSKKTLSFSIENLEIMASSYTKKYYFTIDLITGKTYQINDFLGSNYQVDSNKAIQQIIKQQIKEDSSTMYFMDKINTLTITKEQPFYITKDGDIALCFDKYQIAPGYMGNPEFIIKPKKRLNL